MLKFNETSTEFLNNNKLQLWISSLSPAGGFPENVNAVSKYSFNNGMTGSNLTQETCFPAPREKPVWHSGQNRLTVCAQGRWEEQLAHQGRWQCGTEQHWLTVIYRLCAMVLLGRVREWSPTHTLSGAELARESGYHRLMSQPHPPMCKPS